jgi:hypothetical protein
MWQELLITDLTLMKAGRICFAGINHQGEMLRALLPPEGVYEEHIYQNGAPFIYPRAVVNLHLTAHKKLKPPHIEDATWGEVAQARLLRHAADNVWRAALNKTAFAGVEEAFGAHLNEKKWFNPGEGERSLVTIKLNTPPTFYCRPKSDDNPELEYRVNFTDGADITYKWLPITDLTLRTYVEYMRAVEHVSPGQTSYRLSKFFEHADVYIRLGITRSYRKSSWDQPKCYLQVNGIYSFPDYLRGRTLADLRADMP